MSGFPLVFEIGAHFVFASTSWFVRGAAWSDAVSAGGLTYLATEGIALVHWGSRVVA